MARSKTRHSTESVEDLEEPYYCSPTYQSSEIICPGSDMEETLDEISAKRQRYEDAAKQFMARGRPRLISTSLRGPLESGWANPWAYRPRNPIPIDQAHVVSRAASHGVGYMGPKEALAWFEASAQQGRTGRIERDTPESLMNSVERDDEEEMDVVTTSYRDEEQVQRLSMTHNYVNTPHIGEGNGNNTNRLKRPVEADWLKGSYVSKRARWDGPNLPSPTPAALDAKRRRPHFSAKVIVSRALHPPLSGFGSIQRPRNVSSTQAPKHEGTPSYIRDAQPAQKRYNNASSGVPDRQIDVFNERFDDELQDATFSSFPSQPSPPRTKMRSSPPIAKVSPNVTDAHSESDMEPDELTEMSLDIRHSIKHITNDLSPPIRSSASKTNRLPLLPQSVTPIAYEDDSFITEVAPSSRNVEQFMFRKKRKATQTQRRHVEPARISNHVLRDSSPVLPKVPPKRRSLTETLQHLEETGQLEGVMKEIDELEKSSRPKSKSKLPSSREPSLYNSSSSHPLNVSKSPNSLLDPKKPARETMSSPVPTLAIPKLAATNSAASSGKPGRASQSATKHAPTPGWDSFGDVNRFISFNNEAESSPLTQTALKTASPANITTKKTNDPLQIISGKSPVSRLRRFSFEAGFGSLSFSPLGNFLPQTSGQKIAQKEKPVTSAEPVGFAADTSLGDFKAYMSLDRLLNKPDGQHTVPHHSEQPKSGGGAVVNEAASLGATRSHIELKSASLEQLQEGQVQDGRMSPSSSVDSSEISERRKGPDASGNPMVATQAQATPGLLKLMKDQERRMSSRASVTPITSRVKDNQSSQRPQLNDDSEDNDASGDKARTSPIQPTRDQDKTINSQTSVRSNIAPVNKNQSSQGPHHVVEDMLSSQDPNDISTRSYNTTPACSRKTPSRCILSASRERILERIKQAQMRSENITTADPMNDKSPVQRTPFRIQPQSISSNSLRKSSDTRKDKALKQVKQAEIKDDATTNSADPSDASSSYEDESIQEATPRQATPTVQSPFAQEMLLANGPKPHADSSDEVPVDDEPTDEVPFDAESETSWEGCGPQSPWAMETANVVQAQTLMPVANTIPPAASQDPDLSFSFSAALADIIISARQDRDTSENRTSSASPPAFDDENFGIRPFRDFMSPSPPLVRRSPLSVKTPINTQQLVNAALQNPWTSSLKKPTSRKPRKSVTFAYEASPDSPAAEEPEIRVSHGSPPPDDDILNEVMFGNEATQAPPFSSHFKVARTFSRILPPSSQSPMKSSPPLSAQAEAFIAADLSRTSIEQESPTRHLMSRSDADENSHWRDWEREKSEDVVSLRRSRSPSEDLVSAGMANFDMDAALKSMGDFLGDWSVEAEVKQTQQEPSSSRRIRREDPGERKRRLFGLM